MRKMLTSITPNTDNFHAVIVKSKSNYKRVTSVHSFILFGGNIDIRHINETNKTIQTMRKILLKVHIQRLQEQPIDGYTDALILQQYTKWAEQEDLIKK